MFKARSRRRSQRRCAAITFEILALQKRRRARLSAALRPRAALAARAVPSQVQVVMTVAGREALTTPLAERVTSGTYVMAARNASAVPLTGVVAR
jgi:hypothetical protein